MAEEEFKPREVVQVLSGGPKMTVTQVGTTQLGILSAWCVWFEGNRKIEGTFPVTALKHVES